MKNCQLILSVLLIAFCSCQNNSTGKNKINNFSIPLDNWYILGPFKNDEANDYLHFNNLGKWGYTENQIDFNSFINILPDSGVTISHYDTSVAIIDFCRHFRIEPFKNSFGGNAYAACIFNTEDTANFYLNFTSDDGGKVFLNHEMIVSLEKSATLVNYEIYKKVKLKAGKNFLLIKVNNGLNNWQASVRIEKFNKEGLKEHNNHIIRLNNNRFFKTSIYDTSTALVLSENIPDAKMKLKIYSEDNSQVLSETVFKNMENNLDISELSDGLYFCKLFWDNRELNQFIYIGDLLEATAECIQRLKNANNLDMDINGTIEANVFRYRHLLKPSNRGNSHSEKHNWQRKMIYLYMTLLEIEKNISKNKTLEGIPHIALHSFVSRIDDQLQYYISHVPHDYNADMKYPIAIFAPYRVADHQPYLESMRIADIDIQENLQYLSDKYQMIVLEPFCREVGRLNFNSIGETDLFEVLNSFKKYYNVDTTRIFLTGSCAGAEKALMFAVKYPDFFAGIGIVSPAFESDASGCEWYIRNLPLNYIGNLREMPMFFIHSSNDRHTDVSNSLLLERLAKENQLANYTFVKTENDVEEYFWYKHSGLVFEFISGLGPKLPTVNNFLKMGQFKYNTDGLLTIHERNNRDFSTISLKVDKNNVMVESSNVGNFSIDLFKLPINNKESVMVYENKNLLFKGKIDDNDFYIKNPDQDQDKPYKTKLVEGPLTEMFSDRFIVVIGSVGNAEETRQNDRIAQWFENAWKDKYFNSCNVKYDYQIDDQDIENANLFLIGNFFNNQILNSIRNKIPLEISKDKVRIGNYTEIGKDLNVYMVYPNPKNRKKYIGVFSGSVDQDINNLMDMTEEEFMGLLNLYQYDSAYFDISCFGWYDFKIWDKTGKVYYRGYFNDEWKN